MKRWEIVVSVVLALLLFGGIGCSPHQVRANTLVVQESAGGYSYEGRYDPIEFFSWEVLNMGQCPNGHIHALLQDPNSDIQVETVNIPADGESMRIIAYVYADGGVRYTFIFDDSTGNYIQVDPPLQPEYGI